MKKLLIIIIFILFEYTECFSQYSSVLEKKVSAYIDTLLTNSADTIVYFTKGLGDPMLRFTEVKGIGEVEMWESITLIYFKKEKVTAAKFIHYNSSKCSSSIDISNDTAMKTIRQLIPKLKNEKFLPYIIEIENYGVKGYTETGASNPTDYDLRILSSDSSHYFRINPLSIEFFENGPLNLNMQYNKSLSLYPFYTALSGLLERLEPQFDFTKPN